MNSTNRPRIRRVALRLALALAALACAAYVFRGPILRGIGAQLVRSDPLVRSDAIIVLAGGTPMRELEAVDLYSAGYAPRIILTTEPEDSGYETLRKRGIEVERPLELRSRIIRSLGVPEASLIILRQPVVSTGEEATLIADWVARNRPGRVIVVTSTFHTGRAGHMYRRLLAPKGVDVLMAPVRGDGFEPSSWWHHRQSLRTGVFEWQKLVFYRIAYH